MYAAIIHWNYNVFIDLTQLLSFLYRLNVASYRLTAPKDSDNSSISQIFGMEDKIDILEIYTQWMNTICKKIHQIKYAMHDLTNNEATIQGHASPPPPANPSLPPPPPVKNAPLSWFT